MNQCPACGAASAVPFFRATLPADVGHVFVTAQAAAAAPTGEVALHYCETCSFVHNSQYVYELVSFKPGYEISLVHSAVFRDYIEALARRLVQRYRLRGGTVVEVGSGNGEFLRLLCAAGGNIGHGFDPSLDIECTEPAGDGVVHLHRREYGVAEAALSPDLLCCLSVFEALERPRGFLRDIRTALAGSDAAVYFDVFNGSRALNALSGWSVLYEQCNYWSEASLRACFTQCGFAVTDAGGCYGEDEYLYIEARLADARSPDPVATGGLPLPAPLARLQVHHDAEIAAWRVRLASLHAAGKRVCVWGTGGKGVAFLHAMPATHVDCVVDINPDRQQRFVPVSAHRIEAAEDVVKCAPALVVVTNPLYKDEIMAQVRALGISCEFAVA